MKKGFQVVVAGHVCIDITPKISGGFAGKITNLLVPGKLTNIGDASISTGGAVSNTGLALTRLGVETGLMGKVGDDLFGAGIRSLFKENGAGDALTVVKGEQTSYSVILALPGIDRIILHNPGANDTFAASDINYDLAAGAGLFHFGYPPLMRKMYINKGRELGKIFRRLKKAGVVTSMDMSLPDPDSESGKVDWTAVLSAVLPYVDIAPFSAEEAMFVFDRKRFDKIRAAAGHGDPLGFFTDSDFIGVADRILELGSGIALVKCGYRGLLLKTAGAKRLAGLGLAGEWRDRTIWKNTFSVKNIASATGAGDSAIAGFIAAFVNRLAPEKCVSVAACVGAQNVQTFDAVSGIGSWQETLRLMRGMKLKKESPGPGWKFNVRERVWFCS